MEFEPFAKIARLKREMIITEKLDGTNAQVNIIAATFDDPYDANDPYILATMPSDGENPPLLMRAGSRKRFIAPEGSIEGKKGTDNFGFAAWVKENAVELFKMGEGIHYGEWYGNGIQRGYGLKEKHFALFNVARWGDHNPNTPSCCEVVTRIRDRAGEWITDPDEAMERLNECGSLHVTARRERKFASPGSITRLVRYPNPEGIVCYHTASRTLYKQTFEMDGGKWTESKDDKLAPAGEAGKFFACDASDQAAADSRQDARPFLRRASARHKERFPEQYCVNCGQWMCGGTACCANPKAPAGGAIK